MIKDELKEQLIKYISYLTDNTLVLDGKSFEELYAIYLEILGIRTEQMEEEILKDMNEYYQNNPDIYIDVNELLYELDLLSPINMSYLVGKNFHQLKNSIIDKKKQIDEYNDSIKSDTIIIEDKSTRSFQRSEIENDIGNAKMQIDKLSLAISKDEPLLEKEELIYHKLLDYNERTRG